MTAVIWIDWYAYHVARFRALIEHKQLQGQVSGIELIGGCGVHAGLNFREQNRAGLPILSLFPNTDWRSAGQIKMAREVWRKLQQLRPAAVLAPGYYTAPALAAAIWARWHGSRSILMSETTRRDYPRVWWKEWAKRLLVRALFDRGIAGGKPHVQYLRELGFPPERIARFYDVVDNRFYRDASEQARRAPALRQSLNLPHRYFLYVGRLAEEKNVSGLIEAFAAYRERGGTWGLVIVGDGPLRRELEEQCAGLGITAIVRFAGLQNARDTADYYALAGCFVLPSTREPWGLVVNEAMASGLPVLVSVRCGCAEDLVEQGGNGFLFEPRQYREIASRMLWISSLEPSKLESMGRRSREIIAEYSPEHWASEVARIVQC